MRRVYWDSCVVIYRLQGISPWGRLVAATTTASRNEFWTNDHALEKAASGRLVIRVFGPMTTDEGRTTHV